MATTAISSKGGKEQASSRDVERRWFCSAQAIEVTLGTGSRERREGGQHLDRRRGR